MNQNGFQRYAGLKEIFLHNFWLQNKFPLNGMLTVANEDVRILSAGWYNRGWGPDFTNARIEIGEKELFGDVEIHIYKCSEVAEKIDSEARTRLTQEVSLGLKHIEGFFTKPHLLNQVRNLPRCVSLLLHLHLHSPLNNV